VQLKERELAPLLAACERLQRRSLDFVESATTQADALVSRLTSRCSVGLDRQQTVRADEIAKIASRLHPELVES